MEKTYIQITSGRGPVECCRVVVLIMQKIIEQARELGLGTELVEHEDGPQSGCMFSATLSVEGDDTNLLTNEWEGSVLWVAQKNPFRPWHRRKNWFVGVHAIKPLEKAKVSERDINVVASDLRSQSQNKKLAYERLMMKLSAMEEEKQMHQTRDVWMNHNTLERGNPVKIFKGDL